MKRLWVILFVLPLFAQENPCENEKYLKLKRKVEESDILALNRGELDSYVNLVGLCNQYGDLLLVTFEEINELSRERIKSRRENLELKTQNDQLVKQNKELVTAITEAQKYLINVQTETKNDPNDNREVLQHLLNIYQDYKQDVNTPSTPSRFVSKFCQFDNAKLFENGQTKSGQGLTQFRLWICPQDNSHQFWLPD